MAATTERNFMLKIGQIWGINPNHTIIGLCYELRPTFNTKLFLYLSQYLVMKSKDYKLVGFGISIIFIILQLSIGAVKNISLPGGSLRRFGLVVGSSIVA
jgi:hypothetical protein